MLEADRGAAIAQADAAEQERDDLAAQVAELGSSVDSLTAERDDAVVAAAHDEVGDGGETGFDDACVVGADVGV